MLVGTKSTGFSPVVGMPAGTKGTGFSPYISGLYY
jgi:hypothetical protein